MTITSRDGLIDALGNSATTFIIAKASLANQAAGGWTSLWRSAGVPGQGGIPAAAAICTKALTGAFTWSNPVAPVRSYLARAYMQSSVSATTVEIHDRLAHMGGLSGTLTTAQNVGIDLSVSTSNLELRRGDANYSDVQWWLEWYADTGATASNATVNVTYDDGSSGNLALIAVGGTVRAGRMLPLIPAVPGRFIRAVNTVTLSASTATAGNFGVTATRELADMDLGLANKGENFNWADLGLPRVHDDACLFLAVVPNGTASGALNGSARLVQG